jgi:hypothetical protein
MQTAAASNPACMPASLKAGFMSFIALNSRAFDCKMRLET